MSDHEGSMRVSHVNIRLSISIMLLKLLFVEVILAVLVVVFHFYVFNDTTGIITFIMGNMFNAPVFITLVIIKILTTFFIVLEWLNEYYEIMPAAIHHRRGVIFKTEERYPLSHVRYVEFNQSFLGRLLNFGTISFTDERRIKLVDMFMIHHPMRYVHIIEQLLPSADIKKKIIREHFTESETE